jgi:CrcB protein
VRDQFVRRGVEAWRVIVAINLVGAALIGVLGGTGAVPDTLAWAVAAGALAGWTTSSAFSVDVVLLWQRGRRGSALACWVITVLGAPCAALAAGAAVHALAGGAP